MHNKIASKDFSRKTLGALARAGVVVVGATFVPGSDGSFANGERCYMLVKDGCQFIRSHGETLALAEGKAALRG